MFMSDDCYPKTNFIQKSVKTSSLIILSKCHLVIIFYDTRVNYFIIKTGHLASWLTALLTLPKTNLLNPVCP